MFWIISQWTLDSLRVTIFDEFISLRVTFGVDFIPTTSRILMLFFDGLLFTNVLVYAFLNFHITIYRKTNRFVG